jgi:hypothetical protein
MITIVEEHSEHRAAVMALHRAAFGGDYEADLIAGLDGDGLVVASLVALERGEVVGHILFSDLPVEVEGRPIGAVSRRQWPFGPPASERVSAPASSWRAYRAYASVTEPW